MLKKTFLIISFLLLLYLWITVWDTYLWTHTYYLEMIWNSNNWTIALSWLFLSLIPWLYFVYAKKKKISTFLWLFFLWLILFWFVFTSVKWGVWWWLKLTINSFILFGIWTAMFILLTWIWDVIKNKVLWLESDDIYDVLISLWLWLSVFLLLNYILINLQIFYPVVSWLQVIIAACILWYQKDWLQNVRSILYDTMNVSSLSRFDKIWLLTLFSFTCLYFFLGFYLSDIAYSTAWDANHSYMFFPKMWALNNWYYWNEIWMASWFQLWYAYIAFWFSLFAPTWWIWWISLDNIAISLNFWSWLFVILLGLWLLWELIKSLKNYWSHHDRSFRVFLLWWLLFLLWLTSWMWAFLVFVDNKIDLWVMLLLILALYSWLVALRSIHTSDSASASIWNISLKKKDKQDISLRRRWLTYKQWILLILSWFFYAVAWLAKPTALFDVANFAIFSFWIWIWPIWAIWILLAIIWLMSVIKFRGIEWYIGPWVWKIVWWLWIFMWFWDILRSLISKKRKYIWYMLVRWLSFLFTYLLFKLPFHAARTYFYQEDTSPWKFIERVLFSQTSWNSWLSTSQSIPIYAQLWVWEKTCSLASQWFKDSSELYVSLPDVPWNTYNEDVWRYVGYGWKWNDNDKKKNITPFINPWRWFIFEPWCNRVNPFAQDSIQAKILCENESAWRSDDVSQIQQLSLITQKAIDSDIPIVNSLLTWNASLITWVEYERTMQKLNEFMQWNSVKVVLNSYWDKEIYFPYKYLNFFNITYNRSLQNMSSYYTDIGIIRLILIFFSVVWLIYWILCKNKLLTSLEIVTLFWRGLRFLIGWWIVRYAIWMIVWSIISFVAFVYVLTNWKNDFLLKSAFIWLFVIIWFLQLIFNVIRISSQWWSWAFMWYKSNTWIENQFNEQLQQVKIKKSNFWKNDVFNLQFPHYNKFIQAMNQSSSEEGALIAWTYARYFVQDQTNVKYDQFLTWMWKMTSDADECNSYLRLKDQNKKYIVIDPNIGTVVQWSWNKSLFNRFFASINNSWDIIEDWVMTSLARMVESWYLRYFSSNNLWAKYAYMLPNTSFWDISDESRILERARLSVPRFWWKSALWSILQIAEQRINDWSFIEDLADMYWKNIRINEVRSVISKWELDTNMIIALTQDERYVLAQYLNLRAIKQQSPDQFSTELEKMVKRNIQSWSQLIVLEVK